MLSFLMKLVGFVVLPLALIGWLLRRRLGTDRFNRLAARVVLLSLMTVIALLIGEFAVRAALNDVTTTADNSSWFARRWNRTVENNRLGYRERAFRPMADEGVYRIVVVGDSFTWGQGVKVEDRFTDRMQRSLDETAPGRFEVLNFGAPGHETVDHIGTVTEILPRNQPDYILVQWFWNDWEGDDKSGRPRSRPLIPSDFVHRRLRRSSALYYLLQAQWGRFQRSGGRTVDDYLRERFGDPGSAESLRAQGELRELIRRARDGGVPLGIVLFPDLAPEHTTAFLHQQVLSVCTAEQVPCLDLGPDLAGRPDVADLWVNRFDRHPGPRAHELAAERILETFRENWSAPP